MSEQDSQPASGAGNMSNELLRQYYLDQMGIQCWQLLAGQNPLPGHDASVTAAAVEDHSISEISTAANSPGDDSGLAELEQQIAHCQQCDLHASRTQAIAGRGTEPARLMILLFAPTAEDDRAGKVCSGQQGQLLQKMLAAINLPITSVYITSLLKCRVNKTHTVTPAELGACQGYLDRQIQLIDPEIILVMGEAAARCLLQDTAPLDSLREQVNADGAVKARKNYRSKRLLVTYSPEELIDEPVNKRKAWNDLQLLQNQLGIATP
jgi:uracil-DNA glycosylase family 4